MISKFLEFSFNLYQMYYYVLVIVVAIMLMWKKSRIKSVMWQTIVYCTVFVLAFGAASIVKEKIFLKETIEIDVDYKDGAECTFNGLSYGVFKPNYNLKLQQGINSIDIPIGMNRCIKLISLGECNIIIKSSGGDNSYLLADEGEEVRHDITLYSDTKKQYLLCEMFIKALLIIALTFLIGIIINYFVRLISGIDFEKVKYELIIFGVLFVQLIIFISPEVSTWVTAWYVLNYKDGVGSRLLVGSLVNLFCPNYVTAEFVYYFVFSSYVILCFLIAVLFGKFIRKSESQKSVLYYTAFYLACPGSIVYLWYKNAGRLEGYSLILCLICVVLFEKIKNSYIRYAVVTITLCLTLLIHQGSLFFYCPILMTLVIYDLVKAFDMRKAVLTGGCTIVGLALFFYLQLYSGLRYSTCDEAFANISARTDMVLDYNAVRVEYYAGLGGNFEYSQQYLLEHYDVCPKLFVAFIMSLPMIILIAGIWRNCLKNSETKLTKDPQFWVLLTNVSFLPLYVLMCDWGRWTGALIGILFFQIAYLLYKGEVGMKKTFENLTVFVNNNQFLCMIMLVYLSSLEKITAIFNDLIYRVVDYIR